MYASGKGNSIRQAGTRLKWMAEIALLLLIAGLGLPTAKAAEVPVIKGELGPCSADFTVTDSANKPLYDAKIHVTARYGFMSKRKTELEVGTNSDGKGRIEGLPNKVKKPLEFQIRHAQLLKSLLHDPATECHANFTVALGTP
jgi:hypothetical protein